MEGLLAEGEKRTVSEVEVEPLRANLIALHSKYTNTPLLDNLDHEDMNFQGNRIQDQYTKSPIILCVINEQLDNKILKQHTLQ